MDVQECPLCGACVEQDELFIVADRGVIMRNGKAAVLTPMQMAIFLAMYEVRPRVATYDFIISRMYPDCEVEPEHPMNTLRIFMQVIRDELKRVGITITTSYKFGYALNYHGKGKRVDPHTYKAAA